MNVVDELGPGARVLLSEEDVETTLCVLLDNAHHATVAAGSTDPIGVVVGRDDAGVAIRVEDAGIGVAADVRERLGEPFLTTKEPGEGMGLGLYLVRNLLSKVGGQLEVVRREPAGTRVILRLAQAPA